MISCQWFIYSLIISTYEYMAYSLTHEPSQYFASEGSQYWTDPTGQ